jgi:hypothetical protein
MAYETERGNFVAPTNVISDAISPALLQRVVVAPLIYSEDLPSNTNVKLFRKDGSLTAEEVNESAAQGIDGAEQEITQSSVTSTAVKLAAATIITVEAERFSQVTGADISRYIAEAIARDWDDEVLALFSGFAKTVTCTSTAVAEKVLEAVYSVRSNTAGVSSGMLNGVFDYKAIFELQKDIITSAASVWSQPQQTSLLAGVTGMNGYVGDLPGVRLYATNGLPTSGSDDVALVFDPAIAFGSMVSPIVDVRSKWLGAGDGTRGYATEWTGHIFCDVVEWNDYAGCGFLSDT